MPRGDRTGPWGAGPMTGRGLGYCTGYDAPGYVRGGVGFGGRGFFGRGSLGGGAWGGGYGHRNWYRATGLPRWARYGGAWGPGVFPPAPTAAERTEILRAQAEALRAELAAIEENLASFERQNETQGE